MKSFEGLDIRDDLSVGQQILSCRVYSKLERLSTCSIPDHSKANMFFRHRPYPA